MHVLSVVFALALVLGCVSPVGPIQTNTSVANTSTCKVVITNQPYNATVCENVSGMQQVCNTVVLNYTMSNISVVNLCLQKNLCSQTGSSGSAGNCVAYECSKGLTTCAVNITNLDAQSSAVWSVAATFKADGTTFSETPINQTIAPLQTSTFKFQRTYSMDLSQQTMSCNVTMAAPPAVQQCGYITTLKEVCHQVPSTQAVQTQVCS